MTNYVEAITFFSPGSEVSVVGDDSVYENLVWADGSTPIPKQDIDDWVLANPNYMIQALAGSISFLNDGTPARYDTTGRLVSIDAMRVTFTMKTSGNGARNVYINSPGDISSNLVGVVVPRNAFIRLAMIATQTAVNEEITFGIRINKAQTNDVSIQIPANTSKWSGPISLELDTNDEIAIHLASPTKNIKNPIIILEIVWRN